MTASCHHIAFPWTHPSSKHHDDGLHCSSDRNGSLLTRAVCQSLRWSVQCDYKQFGLWNYSRREIHSLPWSRLSVVVVVGGCGVSVTTVWRIDAERAKKRWFMAGVWKLPELWPPHIPRYTQGCFVHRKQTNFSVSLVNDHLNCQPPRCPFARVGRWRKSLWKWFVNFLSDSYV